MHPVRMIHTGMQIITTFLVASQLRHGVCRLLLKTGEHIAHTVFQGPLCVFDPLFCFLRDAFL